MRVCDVCSSHAPCCHRRRQVVVVTNAHGKRRRGIRYMTNGLKVYYTPMTQFVDGAAFPTMVGSFMLFRRILIREGVTVVHGHQATSVMAHECFLVARTMGYKVSCTATVFEGASTTYPCSVAGANDSVSTPTTRCLGLQMLQGTCVCLMPFLGHARAIGLLQTSPPLD